MEGWERLKAGSKEEVCEEVLGEKWKRGRKGKGEKDREGEEEQQKDKM